MPQARFLAGLYVPLILGSDCLRIRLFKGFKVCGQPRFLPIQNVKAVLVLNAELVLDFAEVAYAPSFSSSFRNSASDRFLSNIFCTALYRSSVQFFCSARAAAAALPLRGCSSSPQSLSTLRGPLLQWVQVLIIKQKSLPSGGSFAWCG